MGKANVKQFPELPGSSDRTTIIGRTGSGKTQFAVWLLSTQDFTVRPWVVIDYKGDKLINGISKAEEIGFDTVPTKPGIYILRVLPGDEGNLDNWFMRVHQAEGIGIYVDEGYMIGKDSRWFNACLTQGRSKQIPMIILTQRPVWMSRFVMSEASYFVVFDIIDRRDMDTVKAFVPGNIERDLPKYHARYFDVGNKELYKLAPVPDGKTILESIDARLPKNRRRAL